MVRVAFLVNGEPGSAMAHRARAFAALLRRRFEIRILYRQGPRLRAPAALAAALVRFRPRLCYVFDMAFAGVAAGACHKLLAGSRLVIDTGDAITALAASIGRSALGRLLTAGLERCSLTVADQIVVRGTFHRDWLARRGARAVVIPDGVETDLFKPQPADQLRRELGLGDSLTVGLVGSMIWVPRLQTCYGWDLVEMIRLLKDRPIIGVVIGSGSGLPVLQQRCREYGIEDRVRFLGTLPYEQLPRYLNVIDVCLSTQSNDLVGQVRTTGKLPLYLACGRYILASRVGEAALVLGEEMLVGYTGVVDPGYPSRLAERIVPLLEDRTRLEQGGAGVAIARDRFDYTLLAHRVGELITQVLRR